MILVIAVFQKGDRVYYTDDPLARKQKGTVLKRTEPGVYEVELDSGGTCWFYCWELSPVARSEVYAYS